MSKFVALSLTVGMLFLCASSAFAQSPPSHHHKHHHHHHKHHVKH